MAGNKCVSKTDINPPFAFQIAYPDFTGFLQGESKSRDLQSEISVRIESRIESADSRLQLVLNFFRLPYRTDVQIRQNYCAIATRLLLCMLWLQVHVLIKLNINPSSNAKTIEICRWTVSVVYGTTANVAGATIRNFRIGPSLSNRIESGRSIRIR